MINPMIIDFKILMDKATWGGARESEIEFNIEQTDVAELNSPLVTPQDCEAANEQITRKHVLAIAVAGSDLRALRTDCEEGSSNARRLIAMCAAVNVFNRSPTGFQWGEAVMSLIYEQIMDKHEQGREPHFLYVDRESEIAIKEFLYRNNRSGYSDMYTNRAQLWELEIHRVTRQTLPIVV